MKKCPFCAEEIRDEAIKCKHCRKFLNGSLDAQANKSSNRSNHTGAVVAGVIVGILILWFTTGVFVIQPIGAVPNGATVWYWRFGTSLPFIGSADGLLLKTQGEVSLLGRTVFLGGFAKLMPGRKIIAFPYSRTLYLISTGGKEFGR